MKYNQTKEDNAVVVSIEGDVDLQHSPKLRRVLLEALDSTTQLIVELTGVNYIDSSGVASLVEAMQRARKKEAKFALVGVSESVMRVLKLARLDKVFPIFANKLDAIANAK